MSVPKHQPTLKTSLCPTSTQNDLPIMPHIYSTDQPAFLALSIQTPITKKRCGIICSCICHRRKDIRVSNALIGTLLIGYSGTFNSSVKCNEWKCSNRAESWLRATYLFPAWYAKGVIALVYQDSFWNSAPPISIRFPRPCLSWMTERLVLSGSITPLQQLFHDRKIHPTDVRELTGENILSVSP